jgi:transposase
MQGKLMQMNELFRVALGLDAPWQVTKVEFSEKEGRLQLWLDFPAGSTFRCPVCAKAGCGAYDSEERTWRHLNFFQHQTLLHARQPRIQCPEHGVKTVEVPWARPGSGFTLLMEAFVLLLVQGGMTPAQVGRLIGEHDTRIWRVIQRYVEVARDRADFSDVTTMGMDETSRARGHSYVTLFTDLAPNRRRVLFVCPERDAQTVALFRRDFQRHGGDLDSIRRVCLDMSPAYLKGLAEHLPQAQITFDPFHVAKLAGEAVDAVRREERKQRPELKGTRYLWLKNEWNHTERQAQQWASIRGLRLQTGRAWLLKSALQDVFLPENRTDGPALLAKWCAWAQRSRLTPMVELARTLRRHWIGVVNWFDSQISNGVLEAINGLVQAAKRRARGYRNVNYLITMIYLLLGKLDFQLPALSPAATHTK